MKCNIIITDMETFSPEERFIPFLLFSRISKNPWIGLKCSKLYILPEGLGVFLHFVHSFLLFVTETVSCLKILGGFWIQVGLWIGMVFKAGFTEFDICYLITYACTAAAVSGISGFDPWTIVESDIKHNTLTRPLYIIPQHFRKLQERKVDIIIVMHQCCSIFSHVWL